MPWLIVGLGGADAWYLLLARGGDYTLLMERFNVGLLVMSMVALLMARRVIPVLYLGHAGLGAGLLIGSGVAAGKQVPPAVPMHTIAMAGFSVLIIGMTTRTALGHLGRPLAADRSMAASYPLVQAAAALRLAAVEPGPFSQLLL